VPLEPTADEPADLVELTAATPDQVLGYSRFLLDTNIISHVIRPKKQLAPGIERFLNVVDEDRLYISPVTIGEIEKGIGKISWPDDPAARAERARLQAILEQRLEQLCDRFSGRITPMDLECFRAWGRLHAKNERSGRSTPVVDTLIATCALTNNLVVATADTDFRVFGDCLTMYNPVTHTLSGRPNYDYTT
jgi:predicted nucleic acid-binding protein